MPTLNIVKGEAKSWIFEFIESNLLDNTQLSLLGASIVFVVRSAEPAPTVTDDSGALILESTANGGITIIDATHFELDIPKAATYTLTTPTSPLPYGIKAILVGKSDPTDIDEGLFNLIDSTVRGI